MTRSGRALLAAGLLLAAFSLRLVFTSLSAVLPDVMATLHLSPLEGGLLTTLPVFCLGLFAPLTPRLIRLIGLERLVTLALLTLAAATALRGVEAYPALLAGSLGAGAAIAVLNVTMPSLVKRDFPDRAALMTGLYSMSMVSGAALAAGATVPIERALGGSWAAALASWAAPAGVAALLWLPRAWRGGTHAAPDPPSFGWLWRDSLAWQVTLFMGFQSALAYSVFAWMAPLLRFRGLDPAAAGYALSLSVMAQILTSFAAPWISTRGRDQRTVAITLALLGTVGLLGALFAPLGSVLIWVAVQGLGQGGLFSVAMTIIILRSPGPDVAAALSGIAQGLGYVLAGLAPLVVGLLRGATDDLAPLAILFVALGGCLLASGALAGRAGLVGANR